MARTVAAAVIERRFGSVTRKSIANVLGEHASVTDDGEWWTIVGQKRIAAEAEVSERTVWQVLNDFESEGLISRTRRHRKDGTRTSDRIEIHEPAVRALPEAVASRPPAAAASSDGGTTRNSRDRLPATGAGPTRKAIATQEPSEEPSVGAAAAAAAVDDTTELPAVQWAKKWAALRGVTFTKTVERSWAAQIQEFIRAGGTPTDELLARAARESIREPKGWAYVTASMKSGERAREVSDWMEDR